MNSLLCCLVLLLTAACAGELKDAGRFDGLLGAGTDAGIEANTSTDASTDPKGGPSGSPVPDCVSTIFETSCGTMICHEGGMQVDLLADGVAGRLVDMPARAAADMGQCEGSEYVSTSGGPNLLLQKVRDADPCGLPMPVTGAMLNDEELACLEAWVTELGGTPGGQ